MRVFIADDEPLALRSMEKLLNEIGGIEVIGKYQDPRHVIEAANRDKPDVIFLDIEMPVMNGLEAAERLMHADPNLKIIFVTAFSEYAVNAFELNALDYLLKPVRKERVIKALQRIRDSLEVVVEPVTLQQPKAVKLRLFQAFQVEYQGQEPESIRWRTAKAQELFLFLLQRNGQAARKDTLITLIWPEYPIEKAYTNLYTTVYQLRKTLTHLGLGIRVLSGDEGYTLDKNGILTDVEEWEAGIKELPEIAEETISTHQEIMRLYRDALLKEYDFQWAERERERLSSLWFHHAVKITDFLMGKQAYSEAISLCHKIQDQHPYSEYSYFNLMKIYAVLGDRAAVKDQFQRLSLLLSDELGEVPDPLIVEWLESWEAK